MVSVNLLKTYHYLMSDSKQQARLSNLFLSLLACGLPFLIYLRTMAPTVYGLDSAELTTGAYWLGIIHAPGAPLYLLLGHLFTWLPLGDVGYRLNLLSACAATLTVLFVYHILLHLTRQRVISLLTTWYLAFTYYFWISALFAELYSVHACFIAGLILLALKWRKQGHPWQFYTLAFCFGLGMGNHLSLVLLGPGFVWLVLSTLPQPWKHLRLLLTATICGLLGASVYLYLPLRHLSDTPINYARDYWQINLASWSGFWWMVTGQMFGTFFFSVPLENLPAELGRYGYQLWSNFLGLGVVIGLIGLVSDFKRRLWLHISLLLMFVGHLCFYLTYSVADKELMFLPTFLIWGLWIGLGVTCLSREIKQRFSDVYHLSTVTLLMMLTVSHLVLNFGYVDLSQDGSARELGEDILAELEPDAVFLGTWRDTPILEYLQLVEGQRPDVTPVQLFFTGAGGGRKIVYEQLKLGHPVYTSASQVLVDQTLQFDYLAGCQCYQVTLIDE
jgi:hypothetical protein